MTSVILNSYPEVVSKQQVSRDEKPFHYSMMLRRFSAEAAGLCDKTLVSMYIVVRKMEIMICKKQGLIIPAESL
jgi:hypothetical protein